MKSGTIKKINDEWVVEYREFNDTAWKANKRVTYPKVVGPSGKVRVGGSNRMKYFESVTLPIHYDSKPLCEEGKDVEFEVIKDWGNNPFTFNSDVDFAKIVPYVPEPHSDRLIGLLVGEILWLRKLGHYTEHSLINTLVTAEERAEYNRLDMGWYDTTEYGKNKSDKITQDEKFEEYRIYARSLHVKYHPHQIEHSELVPYGITDVKAFAEGIEHYLWNTDNCCYRFSVDDIKLERLCGFHANSFKIKFTLDYLPK